MSLLKFVSLTRIFPLLLGVIVLAQLCFLLVVNHVTPAPGHYAVGTQQLAHYDASQSQQQTDKAANAITNQRQRGRFAYAYLIAGCDPSDSSYRGFLYNVLVSRHLLRMEGSKADVVLLVRMKNVTLASSLPAEEERWLRESGIRLQYLQPPSSGESFYSAMMAKFYILNLTEYSRVMYLDADVMPLCNMDYVFELSEQGVLKENLIVTWWGEPALGAIFMLQPGEGEYQMLEDIVALQQARAVNRWPPFDQVEGWGHKIEPPDQWFVFKRRHGTLWNFQFAFADQGLLYHWVKYVKKSVSILFSRQVLNYALASNGTIVLEESLASPFANVTCPRFPWDVSSRKGGKLTGAPFYHDFKHFTGKTKPWEKDNVDTGIPKDIMDKRNATSPLQLWFHILRNVSRQLNMSLNVERLSLGRPTLGRFPTLSHMVQQARNTS